MLKIGNFYDLIVLIFLILLSVRNIYLRMPCLNFDFASLFLQILCICLWVNSAAIYKVKLIFCLTLSLHIYNCALKIIVNTSKLLMWL